MADWGSGKLRVMAELAGAIAVLIGLIFVGLELRQNTEAVQAATLQNQTDAATDYLLLVASDADLASIVFDASRDQSHLTEIGSFRYFMLVRARWVRMQNAYLQWRRGTLSDEDWSTINNRICDSTSDGTFRYGTSWDEHKTTLSDSFVEFIEGCWSNSR